MVWRYTRTGEPSSGVCFTVTVSETRLTNRLVFLLLSTQVHWPVFLFVCVCVSVSSNQCQLRDRTR